MNDQLLTRPDIEFFRRLVWTYFIISTSIDLIFLEYQNISLVHENRAVGYATTVPVLSVALLSILTRYLAERYLRTRQILHYILFEFSYFTEAICLFFLVVVSSFVNMYIVTMLTGSIPALDPFFIKIDRLFFDWFAYVKWVQEHPTINDIYFFSYATYRYYPIAIFLGFFIQQNQVHSYHFLFVLVASFIIGYTISALMPSEGYLSHLHLNPADFPDINVSAGFNHLLNYRLLRAGNFREAYYGEPQGLITFPSFHVIEGIFYIYFISKIRYYCIPIIALIVLMLAATPVIGAHYFVDCIGGLIIAAIILIGSKKLLVYKHRNQPAVANSITPT